MTGTTFMYVSRVASAWEAACDGTLWCEVVTIATDMRSWGISEDSKERTNREHVAVVLQ
jgi:hypothetical protein